MQELGASTTGGAETGAAAAPGAAAQGSSAAPVVRSREATESAFGMGMAEMMAAYSIDGVAAYPGRQTQELVVQAHGHWKAGGVPPPKTSPNRRLGEGGGPGPSPPLKSLDEPKSVPGGGEGVPSTPPKSLDEPKSAPGGGEGVRTLHPHGKIFVTI